MGRWAQRRRAGTVRNPDASSQAHITAVHKTTVLGNDFADVTFDTTVTAATPGIGDMQVAGSGSPIDSQPSANVVRYGSYDPFTPPVPFDLDDATGLTFAGGKTLGPPTTGTVT
jgi:hypothetical protein